MAEHTTYGKCSGCRRWVTRDEMLSINTDVYDASNRRRVFRQRYCPTCYEHEVERLTEIEWRHVVVEEFALSPFPSGEAPPDAVVLERMRVEREARRVTEPLVDKQDGNR